MSDEFSPAEIAHLDQAHAGAMELARTIAAQWRTYMEAGMPKWCAGNLVCGYQEAVLRPDEEVVEVYGDE